LHEQVHSDSQLVRGCIIISSTRTSECEVTFERYRTIENPETYSSNKYSDIVSDDTDSITSTTDQTQSPILSVQCMSSPNTKISLQGLVKEVLRSPDSEGDSEGESVVTVNADNAIPYAALATSIFYGKKISTKKGYLKIWKNSGRYLLTCAFL